MKYFSTKKEFFQSDPPPLLPSFVKDSEYLKIYTQISPVIQKIKDKLQSMINIIITKKFTLLANDLNDIRQFLNGTQSDNILYYAKNTLASIIDQLTNYKKSGNETNNYYINMFSYFSAICSARLLTAISILSDKFLNPKKFKQDNPLYHIYGVLAFREYIIYIVIDSFNKINSIITGSNISSAQIESTIKELFIRQNVLTPQYPLLLDGSTFGS